MASVRPVTSIRRGQRLLFEEARDAASGSSFREVINAAPVVAASTLARVADCEKQAHLARTRGDDARRPALEYERLGPDGARELSDAVWNRIDGARSVVVRAGTFVWKDDADVPPVYLVASPDAVTFTRGRPTRVVVRSFVTGRERVARTDAFRGWLYCFLLDELGFDTSDLRHVVVATEGDGGSLGRLDAWVRDAATDGGLASEDATVASGEYDPAAWGSTVEAALAYWRGDRRPEATHVATKCRACRYADVCDESRC